MTKSSLDNFELWHACTVAVAALGVCGEEVAFLICIAKGRDIFEKLSRLAEPHVQMLTDERPISLAPLLSLLRFAIYDVLFRCWANEFTLGLYSIYMRP